MNDASSTTKEMADRKTPAVPVAIGVAVVLILVGGLYLYKSAAARTNDVALASDPKPVTVAPAEDASFRASHRYVATVQPWYEAKIGPELVSAYVDTVLVRPGDTVKKGDVLATLDCRSASAQAQSVAMAAKALEEKQAAAAKEAASVKELLDKGFVSQNEADKKLAESTSQQADILSTKAKLLGTSLAVDDCILKAPFDGEVSQRFVDPGAFVTPQTRLLTVIQRDKLRVAIDVPEVENQVVAPNTPIHVHFLATDHSLDTPVTRRSPSADPTLRTIHVEADLTDPTRSIPVGTTADITVDVGTPIKAAALPLSAVSIRGENATVFVVENGIAKKTTLKVIGESGGNAYLDASLVGKSVVTEGRALLNDGDAVKAGEATVSSASPSSSAASRSEK